MPTDGDTPGVRPMDVPRPDADLAEAWISLDPNDGITLFGKEYGANGRIFKWLLGQMQHAGAALKAPPAPPTLWQRALRLFGGAR